MSAVPAAPAIETRLRALIRAQQGALVALSGGVDSSVVAALCAQELPGRSLAVTAISASLPGPELEASAALCHRLGLPHRTVQTEELAIRGYVQNAPSRCYFCKGELYDKLAAVGREQGLHRILDGTHAGDLSAHRPGHRAAREHGVLSPLLEVGADKAVVRQLARRLGLPNAERPASPCLSSRIAYGIEVTPERLERIGRAEAYLRDELGFADVRVRLHEHIARIEIFPDQMPRALEHAGAINERLRRLGFTYVTLDLGGLRSGSLLEMVRASE